MSRESLVQEEKPIWDIFDKEFFDMESNSDAKLQQSPLNMENELSIGEYEEASGVEEFSQQEELDYD